MSEGDPAAVTACANLKFGARWDGRFLLAEAALAAAAIGGGGGGAAVFSRPCVNASCSRRRRLMTLLLTADAVCAVPSRLTQDPSQRGQLQSTSGTGPCSRAPITKVFEVTRSDTQ